MPSPQSVPRGRHAPPLEVRREAQRARLLEAAAALFARCGYADSTAEGIAREAGMSKATFYEHFANKEKAILALFGDAAEIVLGRMAQAAESAPEEPIERVRAGLRAFVSTLAEYPEASQTLLVEIIGAGPQAARCRDEILDRFAARVDAENRRAAKKYGAPRFGPHDAFTLVGAIGELVSRQLRRGEPKDIRDLEPVIERLILGLLAASAR